MNNSKWIKFDPKDIDNIPSGLYYAYGGVDEKGRPVFSIGKIAIMSVFDISNGKLAACDGMFIFDLPYMPKFITPFDEASLIADLPEMD